MEPSCDCTTNSSWMKPASPVLMDAETTWRSRKLKTPVRAINRFLPSGDFTDTSVELFLSVQTTLDGGAGASRCRTVQLLRTWQDGRLLDKLLRADTDRYSENLNPTASREYTTNQQHVSQISTNVCDQKSRRLKRCGATCADDTPPHLLLLRDLAQTNLAPDP